MLGVYKEEFYACRLNLDELYSQSYVEIDVLLLFQISVISDVAH